MRPWRRWAVAAAALALAGCQTYNVPATPSGKIEMTYPSPAAPVKGQLVNFFINKGYSISSDSDFLVTFDKVAPPSFAAALLTCGICQPPRVRPSFTFVETNGETRVVGSATFLLNPGSFREQAVEQRNAAVDADLLTALQSIPGGSAPTGLTMAAITARPPPSKARLPGEH